LLGKTAAWFAISLAANSQTITTFAGNGLAGFSGDGGPAAQAQIDRVVGLATDASGNVYLADENNHRLRKVDVHGVITTLAGTGVAGFAGDGGPAQQAQLNHPTGVCVSPQGDIYVNDVANYRVRKISSAGTITTVAGNGSNASSGDGGQATQASMMIAIRCAVDRQGNLYIVDQGAARVRKVDAGGTISTFAGNGNQSFSGDGGPATAAGLNNPTALAVDSAGNVFITDQFNQRIRKVDASGNISTVAGNGSLGFTGDGGSPIQASFNYPGSIVVDSAGALYVVDTVNNRLRKVSGGVINTVAGTGAVGYGGDGGAASQAILNSPFAIALAANGSLYLGDTSNNRVRLIAAPVTAITEVDNGFSNIPNSPIQAATWVAIKGTNLSNTNPGRGWNPNENFPTSMDTTSVTINSKPAFLYYISPGQVNVQAPSDTALGPVSVVVTNNGVSSAPFTAQLQPFSPALLQWGGGQYPYAEITRNPDNAYIGNPSVIPGTIAAHAGDVLTLWVTGLGAINPAVPAGQQPTVVNGSFPLPTTNPAVTVGGTNVTVLGAILRFAGLYQVNIQLPASLGPGNLPIQVLDGSYQSPPNILLTVQ